jgi:DNA-directed RNA polymerase subunit RPC12/RpoP
LQIKCCRCKKKYSLKIFTPGDCTLFIECPHCGFKHALTFIPFEETIKKIPAKKITLGGGPAYADLGGTRILSVNGVTDHSGADDANVVDWVKTTELIIAVCVHSAGKDTESSTGERIKGQSLSDAIDLPDEYQSELWFGVDVSGADDGHVYSFQLYSTTEGAAIGVCGATLTIEAGASNWQRTIADVVGITDTVTTKRTIVKTLTDTVGITDVVTAFRGIVVTIADTVGITDTVSTLIKKVRTITDTVGITDTVTTARKIVKTIAETVGITDIVTTARKIRRFFYSTIDISDGMVGTVGGGGGGRSLQRSRMNKRIVHLLMLEAIWLKQPY